MEPNQESSAVGLGVDELTAWLERVLFNASDPIVIALKGGWGEGKTYFWRNHVVPRHPSITIVYASVFGAESIQEVRQRVVAGRLSRIGSGTSAAPDDSQNSIGLLARIRRVPGAIREHLPQVAENMGLPSALLNRLLEDQLLAAGMVVCLDQ